MLGRYPFGSQPVSGIALEDSNSTENPLIALLADPHADLAFLMRGRPYDRELGAERDVFLSGHGYATYGNGDAAHEGIPDHIHFPDILISPFNVKVSLLSGGAWQPSAIPGYGAALIADPEGRYEDLIKLDWEQREVTVWVGRKKWIGPSFTTFGRAFTGTVEAMTWDADRKSLHLRDMRYLFEQDVNPASYLGFGGAVRLNSDGARLVVPYDATLEPLDGSGNRVVFFEVMLQAEVLQDAIIATQGGASAWRAVLFASGAVGLFDRESASAVSPTNVVKVGEPIRLSFAASAEGLRILADGVQVAFSPVGYGAPPSAAPLVIGRATA